MEKGEKREREQKPQSMKNIYDEGGKRLEGRDRV